MKFLGRNDERRQIGRAISKKEQQTILVYGRRRVGKTELIKQCLCDAGDMRCIYYECKQTTESDNVWSLSTLVADTFGLPPLAFNGVEDALEFLFRQSAAQPLVVVLDEYPYLREAVHGLDSILQTLIDRHKADSRLTLIICGSFVETMRALLENSSPLYGRVDLTLRLLPMDYHDSALFYPEFSLDDRVRLYSVFGGIPYYNRLIDPSLSVRENIIELVASPGARFENEVPLFLGSEIRKMTNANEVFSAMAFGYSKYKDILDQSHVSSGPSLVDTLEKLIKMELAAKQAPINDPTNRRKASYHITDRLSLFYYRYVFRYLSQMSIMNSSAFYDRYIEDDFESRFVPLAFEEVCRQYLVRQNRAGKIGEPFDAIGKYWYDGPVNKTNGEFDIVTHDKRGYVFYEAKFRSTPVTEKMIADEIAQVRKTGLECYRYGFFSRSGFDATQTDELVLVDIKELYA